MTNLNNPIEMIESQVLPQRVSLPEGLSITNSMGSQMQLLQLPQLERQESRLHLLERLQHTPGSLRERMACLQLTPGSFMERMACLQHPLETLRMLESRLSPPPPLAPTLWERPKGRAQPPTPYWGVLLG